MIKKYIAPSLLFLWSLSAAHPLNIDQTPSPQLLELLKITGVQHDGTLKGIVDGTQKVWVRSTDKELWQVQDVFKDKRDQIIPLLEDMGCLKSIAPTKKYYHYAVILGSPIRVIRSRLAFLIKQWDAGVRFEQIIFLAGQRSLDPVQESEAVLINQTSAEQYVRPDWKLVGSLPTTETEAAKVAYQQATLSLGMEKIQVTFIDAPCQKTESGLTKRPSRADTIDQWLKTNPAPGSCLCISGQPFCLYDDSIVSSLLPLGFVVETVGQEANPQLALASHLDTLARYLYSQYHKHHFSGR